jgi:RNA polymerase sigma factor (sigma-70 family)
MPPHTGIVKSGTQTRPVAGKNLKKMRKGAIFTPRLCLEKQRAISEGLAGPRHQDPTPIRSGRPALSPVGATGKASGNTAQGIDPPTQEVTPPVAAIGTAPEDASLVRSALAGETRAFEKLVEHHFESVHLIAFARLGNREMAEDLTQEVFLRAFLGLHQLRDPAHFAAWVNQITRNLALNWIRQRRRASRLVPMVPIEQLSQEIPDTEAPDTREALATAEQEAAVQEAIGDLRPEQREVVLLHFAQGLSKSEIAHRLGTHPSTVGRRLDSALRCLRSGVEAVLRETSPSLRPAHSAMLRILALVGAMGAMSSKARAAVADLRWSDAVAHCEWLSEREGVTYSLPTEAQWECACRTGSSTAWSFGDAFDPALALVDIRGVVPPGHNGDVGFFPPNAFGLYDMHGNISEMCSDPFMTEHRADSTWRTDESWAVRGGSWHTPVDHSRPGTRCSVFSGERAYSIGFRVVRAVE